uniref:Uncharacterized protein n=1 Tax=Caenorhabditis japonica TaxID=281687 RepID=A0A8R1HKA6_CAEJA
MATSKLFATAILVIQSTVSVLAYNNTVHMQPTTGEQVLGYGFLFGFYFAVVCVPIFCTVACVLGSQTFLHRIDSAPQVSVVDRSPCYLESGLQVIDSSKNFSRDLPFQHAPNAEIHRIEIRAGSRPQVLVQESREMRLQDGQCRSRAMGRCPVLLKDKWTTSKVPSKNSNRRRRNLKASSDLSTSEASLEQEFNGRTMRRTFHSSAIWRSENK